MTGHIDSCLCIGIESGSSFLVKKDPDPSKISGSIATLCILMSPGMRIRQFFPRIRIRLSREKIPDPDLTLNEEKKYIYILGRY